MEGKSEGIELIQKEYTLNMFFYVNRKLPEWSTGLNDECPQAEWEYWSMSSELLP